MKGILYLPNKRVITNTHDIYFQKRECNFHPVVKILTSLQNVEELIFNAKIVNNTSGAGNLNRSVF